MIYRTLREDGHQQLDVTVNDHLRRGWLLRGDLVGDGASYLQVVTFDTTEQEDLLHRRANLKENLNVVGKSGSIDRVRELELAIRKTELELAEIEKAMA